MIKLNEADRVMDALSLLTEIWDESCTEVLQRLRKELRQKLLVATPCTDPLNARALEALSLMSSHPCAEIPARPSPAPLSSPPFLPAAAAPRDPSSGTRASVCFTVHAARRRGLAKQLFTSETAKQREAAEAAERRDKEVEDDP